LSTIVFAPGRRLSDGSPQPLQPPTMFVQWAFTVRIAQRRDERRSLIDEIAACSWRATEEVRARL
jgi:hypothetical protein